MRAIDNRAILHTQHDQLCLDFQQKCKTIKTKTINNKVNSFVKKQLYNVNFSCTGIDISIKEIQLVEFLNFLYGKVDPLLIKTFMLELEEEDIKNYIKWTGNQRKAKEI